MSDNKQVTPEQAFALCTIIVDYLQDELNLWKMRVQRAKQAMADKQAEFKDEVEESIQEQSDVFRMNHADAQEMLAKQTGRQVNHG